MQFYMYLCVSSFARVLCVRTYVCACVYVCVRMYARVYLCVYVCVKIIFEMSILRIYIIKIPRNRLQSPCGALMAFIEVNNLAESRLLEELRLS